MKHDPDTNLPPSLEDLVLGPWQPIPELDEEQAANRHRMARLLARRHHPIEPDSLLIRVWLECLESVDWGDTKRVNQHYQMAVHRQVFFNVLHRVAPQVGDDLFWTNRDGATYVPCMAADLLTQHHGGVSSIDHEAAVLIEKTLGEHVKAWQKRWNLSDPWCYEAAMSSLTSAGSLLRDGMLPIGQLHIGICDMSESPETDVSVLGYMLTIDSRDYDPAIQSESDYLTAKLKEKDVRDGLIGQLRRRNRIAGTVTVTRRHSFSEKFETLIRVKVLKESPTKLATKVVNYEWGDHSETDEVQRRKIYVDLQPYANEIGLTI